MFVFIGAQPHTDWLEGVVARDERGFILAGPDVQGDGWPLEREPYPLETSVPGIFVAGDVRARSIKRVASAVGEGSMAGLVDPPVPGERMTQATLAELRTIDLFDDLDDEQLAEWVAVADRRDARAGRH